MPNPLQIILLATNEIAKQNLNTEIICPRCGERRNLIKWGFYTRYLFHNDDTIRVQRFRCLNTRCPRSTFSILPHPLLPFVRMPLCFIMTLLSLYQKGCSVADLSRKSAKSWAVVRRSLNIAKKIQTVLQNEIDLLLPCLNPAVSWTLFTHAFSWALFPKRC